MDTQALKQKILDLAIRGKLVPQDPNDEPASVLLERIRIQKEQMVKEGKLKSKELKNDTIIFKGEDNLHYEKFQDGSVKCIEDEIPFETPQGWAITKLDSLLTYEQPTKYIVNSTKYKKTYNIPVLTAGKSFIIGYTNETNNIFSDLPVIIFDDFTTESKFVNFPFKVKSSAIKMLHINTELVLPKYAFYLMQTTEIDHENHQRYWISHFSQAKVALPPLNEQNRIVEKTEQVLELVSKAGLAKTDLAERINEVKSKILDLAIRGKLVPQDPNDEPASVLLEHIRAEKEELIKQGKIKRDKKESVIFKGDDNSYYVKTGKQLESINEWGINILPNSWELCCLGELCDYGSCVNIETEEIDDSSWILDLEDIEKDTGRILQKITKRQRNSISTKHRFHSGQVLYSKLRPYLNKVVLSDEDGYCTSEILPLDFAAPLLSSYARYYLMSPTFLAYADRCSYGVKMPRLSTRDGKKAIITVPPLLEQQRIVTAIESCFEFINNISQAIL